jgi:methyltransferase
MMLLLAGATGLRYWTITTLGERWTTRVLVRPGVPLVTRGPYRWLRHPNYLAVVIEIAALPLVHGAWLTAVIFSVLNAALLMVRIAAENEALGAHAG